MIKKLTRTGNSVAIVLDKPLLEQLGISEDSEVEISTNGQFIVIGPVPNAARKRKFQKAVEKMNAEYEGLFRRLSK